MAKVERKLSKRELVLWVVLMVNHTGWVTWGFCRPQTGGPADPSLRIVVRTHDYAGIDPVVLEHAEKEMTRVLAKTGIEVSWVDYARTRAESILRSNDPQTRTLRIDISLVPHRMEAHYPITRDSLGFTFFTHEGERCSVALVFYDRVKKQARNTTASEAQILGCAMAHELGHLLLRTSGHSSAGIMRARWTPSELQTAAWGRLLFTAEETEVMRSEVRGTLTADVATVAAAD